MNAWPGGRPLSDDDLLAIADADGRDMTKLADLRAHMHHPAMFRSHLLSLTGPARLAMFWRRELDLAPPPRLETR